MCIRDRRSGHLVDVLAALDAHRQPEDDRPDLVVGDEDDEDDEDPPLTATEAFLRSAHIDHGDPPLPQVDDTEVGARYARDAMRATARARARRDRETLEVLPERDPHYRRGRNGKAGPDERSATDEDHVTSHASRHVNGDADGDDAEGSGKPLGWLFRSSS